MYSYTCLLHSLLHVFPFLFFILEMWPRGTHSHTWQPTRAEDWKRYGGVNEGRQRRILSMRAHPWAIQTKSSCNQCPVFLIQLTWIYKLLLLLPRLTLAELKIDQGEVESSVGAAMWWVNAVLSEGLTLSLIFMPLCWKDKGDGVRDEERTRLCACSDAWVAISAASASTSPEGRGGGCGVGRALRETKEGGCRVESWISET